MLTCKDHLLILSYIAASIIFPNAQRPGVVQHMTLPEYEEREYIEDKIIIRVMNHKTSASRGPASIIITSELEKIINRYVKYIRNNTTPQTDELKENLFLTMAGNEFKKISETIQSVAIKFNIHTPSPNIHRKVIATEGRKNLDDGKMRSLATHMAHTETTSRKFYQFPSDHEAFEVHNTIKQLIERRSFNEEEDSKLLQEYPLINETTPPLEICKLIVKKYELERTPKQIQDRWRTLKNRINKM